MTEFVESETLYIGGYGRSGSTVLSAVLSAHPDLVSVGEAAFAMEDWTQGRDCSCGKPYDECDFWADMLQSRELPTPRAALNRSVEKASTLPFLMLGLLGAPLRDAYAEYHRVVASFVRRRSGSNLIVDSSKSARLTLGRPLALSRLGGEEVYFLHLVRDGRSTLDSLTRTGSNWALEGRRAERRFRTIRGLIGWVSANLAAACVGRLVGKARYCRIRFEDFQADPDSTVQEIGRFLGRDMTPVVQRLAERAPFDTGHMVGGNRVRFQRQIEVHPPPSTPPTLSRPTRLMFAVLGGWLNSAYGYPRA